MDSLRFYAYEVHGRLIDAERERCRSTPSLAPDERPGGRKHIVPIPRAYRHRHLFVKLHMEHDGEEWQPYLSVTLIPYIILRRRDNIVALTAGEMDLCLTKVWSELHSLGIELRKGDAYLCEFEISTTVALSCSFHVLSDLIAVIGSLGPFKSFTQRDFGGELHAVGAMLKAHDKYSAQIAKGKPVSTKLPVNLARLELRVSGARNIARFAHGREWMMAAETGYRGDMPRPSELTDIRLSLAHLLFTYEMFEEALDYYLRCLMNRIKEVGRITKGDIYARNDQQQFRDMVLWLINQESPRRNPRQLDATIKKLGLLAITVAGVQDRILDTLSPKSGGHRPHRNASGTLSKKVRAMMSQLSEMPGIQAEGVPDEVLLQLSKPNGPARLEVITPEALKKYQELMAYSESVANLA